MKIWRKYYQKQWKILPVKIKFLSLIFYNCNAILTTRSLISIHIHITIVQYHSRWKCRSVFPLFLRIEKWMCSFNFLSICLTLFYFRKLLMLQQFFAFESAWDCFIPAEGMIKFISKILCTLLSNIRLLHLHLTNYQWNSIYFHLLCFC